MSKFIIEYEVIEDVDDDGNYILGDEIYEDTIEAKDIDDAIRKVYDEREEIYLIKIEESGRWDGVQRHC